MSFSSEWTHKKILKLIDLYRQTPVLWARKGQKIHPKQKSLAVKKIADEIRMSDLDVERKLHVLRSQFMREVRRTVSSQLKGGEEIYQSHWKYYKKLEFLWSILEPPSSDVGAKVNPYTSECETSNQSNLQAVSGDGSNVMEDMLTQPNTYTRDVRQNNASIGISDDSSSNTSLMREDQSFRNPDVSGFAAKHDEVGVVQKESQNDLSFTTRREEANEAQEERFINGVDCPVVTYDYSLTTFANHIINLMSRLPLDKSFQLQQKLLAITMDTIIQFEKEHSLKGNKGITFSKQTHDRFQNLTPSGTTPEFSKVNGPSISRITNRNYTPVVPSNSRKANQIFQPNKVSSSEDHGRSRGTPEISIEEFTPISQIKKEIEGFETVYCSGLPPFDSTEPVGGPQFSEVLSEGTSSQLNMDKQSSQTSTELKRHHAAFPDEQQEPSRREKVAPKRLCLENQNLISPMKSQFTTPRCPNDSPALDHNHKTRESNVQ